jgi:hypothetical protein
MNIGMNEEVCDRTRFADEENISSGVEERDFLSLVAMVTGAITTRTICLPSNCGT